MACDVTEEELGRRLCQVEELVRRFNAGREQLLSLSAGVSVYQPDRDSCFQDVFVRADQTMYQRKEEFHSRLKEPYKRY